MKPKHSSPARSGSAIKVSVKEGQSYADILKEMKAKVDPRRAGLEVSFQRQDRSSCVVQREELFTLEELKRAGGRLNARKAPGIDGVPNEILKEVIGAYPEIRLQLLSSGGEVLRRLEEAEVGPAEEGQQTSRGSLIL